MMMMFRRGISKKRNECTEEHRENEATAMKSAGMKSKEDMAAKFNDEEKMSKGGEDALEAEIGEQQEKANTVLDAQVKGGAESEKKLEADARQLEAAGDKMCEQMEAGAKVDQKELAEVQEKAGEVAKAACKKKEWSITSGLKTAGDNIKGISNDGGIESILPMLGLRGLNLQASLVSGGLEEVIDFWNKEIGWFRYGSIIIGTGNLGVGFGGYAGFAWKGYKLDWNLQESYQTALWASVNTSAKLPLIGGCGVAATTAIDADNSAGVPWIPDTGGVNGWTFGWSIGVSLYAGPFGVNVGQSLYHMFTTECFYDKSIFKFVGMMWLPYCLNCTGFVETTSISLMRLTIKVAS